MTRPADLDLEGEQNIFQKPYTALIPMITGFSSVFGSYLVLRELWFGGRALRKTMKPPIVRALLGICVIDLLQSVAFGLATIPTPRSQTKVPFAIGNFETCEAQAFFIQLGNVASPLYFALLTFFYLVAIKYQWTDQHIRKVEVWGHGTIWIVSLASAIFPIPLDLYNNVFHYCWLSPWPNGCDVYDDVECERGVRGGGFQLYQAIFTIFPLWPCVIAVGITMQLVFRQVRKMEAVTASRAWGPTKSSVADTTVSSREVERENPSSALSTPDIVGPSKRHEVNRSRSRAVARQALLFVFAFIAVHALRTFGIFWFAFTGDLSPTLHIIAADVMTPIQGVFNALVLLRTSKLQTPEGKFVQKVYDKACSVAIRALSFMKCRSTEQSSQQGAIEQEDPVPEQSGPTEKVEEEDRQSNGWSLDIVEESVAKLYQDEPSTKESSGMFGIRESNLFNDSNLDNVSSAAPDDSIAEMEKAILAKLGSVEEACSETERVGLHPNDSTCRDEGYPTRESNLFNDSNLDNVSSAAPDDSIAEMEKAILAKLGSVEEACSETERLGLHFSDSTEADEGYPTPLLEPVTSCSSPLSEIVDSHGDYYKNDISEHVRKPPSSLFSRPNQSETVSELTDKGDVRDHTWESLVDDSFSPGGKTINLYLSSEEHDVLPASRDRVPPSSNKLDNHVAPPPLYNDE